MNSKGRCQFGHSQKQVSFKAIVATEKIGASGSLLMATITLESFMPAMAVSTTLLSDLTR